MFRSKSKDSELIETLGNYCGVGLWDAILVNEDALHPQSRWTWTNEFRRLLGYKNEVDFPNTCQAWSDKLHPEDVEKTFGAFGQALKRVPGKKSLYDTTYRLKMADGSYRWFRATGGVVHDGAGKAVRACGSLVDIHEAVLTEESVRRQAASLIELTRAFERDMSALSTTVEGAATELEATARQLASAAEDTSRQSMAVSTSAEEASSSVTAVASAAEELSASVGNIRRELEAWATMSTAAVEEADSTVNLVGELRNVAASIGDVVELINGLAAQTNLLALNATIEAARAGEAGRGFAVVASEVKALATQTASATADISQKVEAIRASTDRSAVAIGSISGTIGKIDSSATSITHAIEQQGSATQEIVHAVHLAARGTSNVTGNIGGVARAAETTGAAATQVLSASAELSQQAGRLRQQVTQFLEGVQRASAA
ncbi:MAG: methyl-accepting chemotaxis protein [Pseudomonadota bacterium]